MHRKYIGTCLLACCCGFFAAACFYYAGSVVSVHYDEYMRAVNVGVYCSRLFGFGDCALPPPMRYWDSLNFFWMMSPYCGAAIQYFAVPFVFMFSGALGLIVSVRTATVVLGALTLCSIFYVVRHVAGRTAALICLFFTAFNVSYIMSFRLVFAFETGLQVAGLWFGLVFLVKFYKTGKPFRFYVAMFVFGLTFWAKIMFLGYMFGAAAGVWALRRQCRRKLSDVTSLVSGRILMFGTLVFAVGCAPLLLFNLFNRFRTVTYLFDVFFRPEGGANWDNSAFLHNVFVRVCDLYHYLSGTVFRCHTVPAPVLVPVVVAAAAFVWAVGLIIFRRRSNRFYPLVVFLVPSYLVLFILSCFLPGDYDVFHILIMTPFCELLGALFAVSCISRFKNRRAAVVFIILALSLWPLGQAYKTAGYLNDIRTRKTSDFFYVDEFDGIARTLMLRKSDRVLCHQSVGWIFYLLHPELNVHIFDTRVDAMPDSLSSQLCLLKEAGADEKFYLFFSGNNDKEKILSICRQYGFDPVPEHSYRLPDNDTRVPVFQYRLNRDKSVTAD